MSIDICLLCGGVGGARAALALSENLPANSLTFVVNTGDDFSYLGLEIWPDWDTVVYTLSKLNDELRGWGRADEGVRAIEELKRLGAPSWFHLGDRDLALHVFRQWQIAEGHSRAEIAQKIADGLGISYNTLRATDQSLDCCLRLTTGEDMDFQDWFVRNQGQPQIKAVKVRAALRARPSAQALAAISSCDLLLIAPSNPYLSIGPMLQVPQLAEALSKRTNPVWAVSPLIDGKAIKGPLDSLISWLSLAKGQQAIVDYYSPWVDALLLPASEIGGLKSSIELLGCDTWLKTRAERQNFCATILSLWDKR